MTQSECPVSPRINTLKEGTALNGSSAFRLDSPTQKSQYTTTHSLGASVLQPVQHKALHRIHPAILCVAADHVLRLRLDACGLG